MKEDQLTESTLREMLLSGQEPSINIALKFLYHSDYWRDFFVESVPCPSAFFEQQFPLFMGLLKIFFLDADNRTKVGQQTLSFCLKTLWRKEVKEELTDDALLQMFRTKGVQGSLAMEVCSERFHNKIVAVLLKKKPNKILVEDIVSNTFVKIYEKLMRTEDFQIKKNLEAYFMASSKYELFGEDREFTTLDGINELKAFGIEKPFDFISIAEEKAKCFEEKVLPLMTKRCQSIMHLVYEGYRNKEIIELLGFNGDAYFRRIKSECMTNVRKAARENCAGI